MMRSMFAGVSGLRNHQARMDVIGNNIANVNTVGYKKSRVTFQDMLSQTMRGASAPQGGRGGSNPQQVGLGMTVGTIDTVHTQGSSETTGKVTDMMVDGDGFFVVGQGANSFYTRAGNFDFDRSGNFVNSDGLLVKGWMANNAGVIDTTQPIGGITIPKGQSIQPKATTSASWNKNLDANSAVGTVWPTTLPIYDSLGNSYSLTVNYTKTAANSWTMSPAAVLPAGIAGAVLAGGAITFNASGIYTAPVIPAPPAASPIQLTINYAPGVGNVTPQVINLDPSKLTQFASPSDADRNTQDGYASGVLQGYAIDSSGTITGTYSNGLTQQLAQVAVTNFNNPGGLIKTGGNLYTESNNSGLPQTGTANTGGRGKVSPGKLEMSNVDLSEEFTNMIITQRGFQANSKIITTSDQMLEELVNLKR